MTRFAETHPADDTEVAEQVTEVVNRLHALLDGEQAAA